MRTNELFRETTKNFNPQFRPLADRLRPKTIDTFLGQKHLLGTGKPLRDEILNDQISSYILWGPPGCGKTTLAKIIAHQTQNHFVSFSGVLGGVKEIREIVALAKERLKQKSQKTILFVDEVHRFNKGQQDAFLPHVEDGTIIFIGATTENPSFELNNALLSRCRVLVLEPLSENDLFFLAKNTFATHLKDHPSPSEKVLQALSHNAQGDARRLLNSIESIEIFFKGKPKKELTLSLLEDILKAKNLSYDQKGEEHYNVISAFIKSLRGSDPDASLYYLARMLEAGEDPRFIARRMIIFASEDIGNADPRALTVAVAAAEAFDRVGIAEGWIPLAQAVTYLATVPKSNASYLAYKKAKKEIELGNLPPVPFHLRNAPTQLMKNLGYGKNYRYPHQDPDHLNDQTYLPKPLENRIFYQPSSQGFEKKIKDFLDQVRALRKSASKPS